MGILTAEMAECVANQELGFVATVNPDGTPNLSPKGTTAVWDDDHLVFCDIHSPGTVRNLESNPHLEINVVDPIVRKGWRFRGTGEIHLDDEVFRRAIEAHYLDLVWKPYERIHHIVLVHVTEVRPLVSPAYDNGRTEDEVIQQWMDRYQSLYSKQVSDRGAR